MKLKLYDFQNIQLTLALRRPCDLQFARKLVHVAHHMPFWSLDVWHQTPENEVLKAYSDPQGFSGFNTKQQPGAKHLKILKPVYGLKAKNTKRKQTNL